MDSNRIPNSDCKRHQELQQHLLESSSDNLRHHSVHFVCGWRSEIFEAGRQQQSLSSARWIQERQHRRKTVRKRACAWSSGGIVHVGAARSLLADPKKPAIPSPDTPGFDEAVKENIEIITGRRPKVAKIEKLATTATTADIINKNNAK